MSTSVKEHKTPLLIHAILLLFAVSCFIPFVMVVSASLSSVSELNEFGFRILPRELDFSAYAYLFANPESIINGYKVTIFITIAGTILGVLVNTMIAFSLSRKVFTARNFLTFFIYIPTLFSGGLTASYIVNTQWLKLTDNIWVMVLPGICSAWTVFMARTFFKQLPQELFDAAKVDGASEWGIYFRIALALSTPLLGTIGFTTALGKWNEWYSAMIYIRSAEKRPLQYLLQRMMLDISALLAAMDKVPSLYETADLPGENLRMALLVVCTGPMMFIFPFFQRYFTKGMVVGAVKG
jgi:putative aldouronate transport system permease protein